MKVKFFQIMDRCTFISSMAIKMRSKESLDQLFLREAGFGGNSTCVLLTTLTTGRSTYKPYEWVDFGHARTMHEAHKYIEKNFDELVHGQVIDVEYILGESDKPQDSILNDPFSLFDQFMMDRLREE